MRRVGDLLPGAARELGLEEELRRARGMAIFEAILAERVPLAAGAARMLRVETATLVVEADHALVAQEIRLHGPELIAAFAAAPGGQPVRELHVRIRSR